MRKLALIGVVTFSLVGLTVGCGSSSKTTSSNASAAPTTPSSGDSTLTGSYVRRVTKTDLARTNGFRHEGTSQSEPPTGAYHLTFTKSTFRETAPTGFAVPQTYRLTGSQLNVITYVNPYQASDCGPDIPQSATYDWNLSGGTLTLHAKHDLCADRDSILQGTWTRIGS